MAEAVGATIAGRPSPGARQRLLAALSLVLGACITNFQDTIFKAVSGKYPFHEMQTIRCGVGLLIIGAVALVGRSSLLLPKSAWTPVMLRGFALATASALYYVCASELPLPAVVALYFTMPLMITLLAGPFLGETVPVERIVVAGLGLAGILAIVQPGGDAFTSAALYGIGAALCYAFGNMLTRRIPTGVTALQTAFWQLAAYFTVALGLAAAFGSGAFEISATPSLKYLTRGWVMTAPADGAFFAAAGISTAALAGLYTYGYKTAEPSFVAPFEYSAMFWAVLFGWLLLGALPQSNIYLGAAVIVASGAFLLWREARGAGP